LQFTGDCSVSHAVFIALRLEVVMHHTVVVFTCCRHSSCALRHQSLITNETDPLRRQLLRYKPTPCFAGLFISSYNHI